MVPAPHPDRGGAQLNRTGGNSVQSQINLGGCEEGQQTPIYGMEPQAVPS